jgi:hypothetical protein|tara:strand:+ start:517 stop:903 length:387 start_codon:yes stop_codon:yes gene_type:complete
MEDQHTEPTRLGLSGMWIFLSIAMAGVGPVVISPFFLFYCATEYDLLPIVGMKGWFVSHFFAGFGSFFQWAAAGFGVLYALGQVLIFISPSAALKTGAGISAFMDEVTPSSSSGEVYVRSHYRRRPRR